MDGSETEEEWDEVSGTQEPLSLEGAANQSLTENIEISIPSAKSLKRKGFTKRDRDIRKLQHKVELLCLLSSGKQRNDWLNCTELHAFIKSILPGQLIASMEANTNALSRITKLMEHWQLFTKMEVEDQSVVYSLDNLKADVCRCETWTHTSKALLFVAACRMFGFDARLVVGMSPTSLSLAKTNKNIPNQRISAEIFMKKVWMIADPLTGFLGECVSNNELPFSSYFVAYEMRELGVKDVTRRYSSSWGVNYKRNRLQESEKGWWDVSLWLFSKSSVTVEDVLDDKKLLQAESNELMPTSLAGFLNHPLYALERHCKSNEAIYPNSKSDAIGIFKNENVFPRSFCQKLGTIENWKREGRSVVHEQSPIKTRKRRKKADEPIEQVITDDVFGYWQTEEFCRPTMYQVLPIFYDRTKYQLINMETQNCCMNACYLSIVYM